MCTLCKKNYRQLHFPQLKIPVSKIKNRFEFLQSLKYETNLSKINDKLLERISLFDLVYVYDDVNDKFLTFSDIVVGIVDEFAPVKIFRLKKDSNVPWIDKELLSLIAKRDIAHGLARNVIDKESCEWHNFLQKV